MNQTFYNNRVDAIAKEYGPKIMELLAAFGEPYENFSDEYKWSLDGGEVPEKRNSDKRNVDIELSESLHYEGSLDGVNFKVSITDDQNECLLDWAPENFTPKVWVFSAEDVAQRWADFESELAWLLPKFGCFPRS